MTWFDWRRPARHPVGQKWRIDEQEFGVIDLGRDMSRDLRSYIDKVVGIRGKPFETGGVLSPAFFPIAGAGAGMASSLFAGNVFLATANNPATLMQIGAGVGSAVMGPTGVIAHAPFIAAGGAIIPVVAPVLLFTAVAAMAICARLDRLQVSLERIESLVRQLLAQELAEDSALLVSAMQRLEDIAAEFEGCGRFTEEMKIRLALAERDLDVLHHKYEILSGLEVGNQAGVVLGVFRTQLFAVSSIANIRVDRLRFKLALQDNPEYVARRLSMVNSKIAVYEASFEYISENTPLKQRQDKLQKAVDDMGFLMKNVFARQKFKKTVAEIEATAKKVKQTQEILSSPVDPKSDDSSEQQHFVCYREQNGKGDLKAYYTADLKLVAQEAA